MAGQTGPKSTWQLTVTIRVATTRFRSPATQNHKPVGNSSDLGEVSSWRQAARGFRPRARQVPKTDASVILLSVPRSDRVPPLTLRLMTRWRRLRSAGLLSDGTSGSATKTQSSPYPVRGRPLMWCSMRRHSLSWTADGSARKGRQMASSFRSQASWATRLRPIHLTKSELLPPISERLTSQNRAARIDYVM